MNAENPLSPEVPLVLGHKADAPWCAAVDRHHTATEAELAEALKKQPINTSLRLFDLVRYMRAELLEQKLITEEEYAELCMGPMAIDPKKGGSPSRARLEEYDAMRAELAVLKAEKARLDWLQEWTAQGRYVAEPREGSPYWELGYNCGPAYVIEGQGDTLREAIDDAINP